MENKSEFYELLKSAVTDDLALVKVLEKIMKLISKHSKINRGVTDEDLRSELIAYSIELIRKNEIYKIFEK